MDPIQQRSMHAALRTAPHVQCRVGCLTARARRLEDDQTRPQLGFALSRRTGGAVVRNRLRRQIRPVMRDAQLPAGWAVVIGVSPARAGITNAVFRSQLNNLAQSLRTQLIEHAS
jgi:ribonuclease P protein component